MGLAHRKAVELEQKLGSLGAEFKDWRDQSESDKSPLRRHHTQIRRVTMQLDGYRAEIATELQSVTAVEAKILADCRKLELDILAVHRIWDFFRSKFVQRHVARFETFLATVDEFAWACYEPARRRLAAGHVPAEEVKEPPLVFFDGRSSPFASPRNRPYEAESVPSEDLPPKGFVDALKSLPIPVISLPWFETQHLPEALVLGHEVGHAVEEDFRLSGRLETLLEEAFDPARIPELRRPAWRRWYGEVFADIYGTLATGPAFVGTLLDFLAADPQGIAAERQPDSLGLWGDYPTYHLRVLINLEVLKHLGFQAEAERLRGEWVGTYRNHAMQAFEPDIPKVVKALVEGPYPELGGLPLKEVLAFSALEQEDAEADSRLLLAGQEPRGQEIRPLLAAVRLAFATDPKAFAAVDLKAKLFDRVQPKVRGPGLAPEKTAEELAAQDPHDRRAGSRLFHAVRALRQGA
jgi:hypothetical protein